MLVTGETLAVHLDNPAIANELHLVGRAEPLSDGASVALTHAGLYMLVGQRNYPLILGEIAQLRRYVSDQTNMVRTGDLPLVENLGRVPGV